MLKLISQIVIIKNSSLTKSGTPVLSNNFNLTKAIEDNNKLVDDGKEVFLTNSQLENQLASGKETAFVIEWVNDIKINSSFKQLTKTAVLTFPRNTTILNETPLINSKFNLFSRGDRIIINIGYLNITDFNPQDGTHFETGTLNEVFRGYITKIGITTPFVIECEDQMFALKQMKVKYPEKGDIGKITFKSLLQRMLTSKNKLLSADQDIFDFNSVPNTKDTKNSSGKIPIICPTDTAPFTYNTNTEKSVAEVFADLKKKLMIYSFFDDFGNLHFELPFINSQQISRFQSFDFEKNIISDSNLKFQKEEEMNLRIRFESKRSNKKIAPLFAEDERKLGFIGDALGDQITVNGPEDMTQADIDKYAKQLLASQKYTGYAKGSKFTTFGEPKVYIGEGVDLNSTKFPEKGGKYAIVGIQREFGMKGYRQEIEIGIGINNL